MYPREDAAPRIPFHTQSAHHILYEGRTELVIVVTLALFTLLFELFFLRYLHHLSSMLRCIDFDEKIKPRENVAELPPIRCSPSSIKTQTGPIGMQFLLQILHGLKWIYKLAKRFLHSMQVLFFSERGFEIFITFSMRHLDGHWDISSSYYSFCYFFCLLFSRPCDGNERREFPGLKFYLRKREEISVKGSYYKRYWKPGSYRFAYAQRARNATAVHNPRHLCLQDFCVSYALLFSSSLIALWKMSLGREATNGRRER